VRGLGGVASHRPTSVPLHKMVHRPYSHSHSFSIAAASLLTSRFTMAPTHAAVPRSECTHRAGTGRVSRAGAPTAAAAPAQQRNATLLCTMCCCAQLQRCCLFTAAAAARHCRRGAPVGRHRSASQPSQLARGQSHGQLGARRTAGARGVSACGLASFIRLGRCISSNSLSVLEYTTSTLFRTRTYKIDTVDC
jgi:hypothetical protein